jgi:hypothetical protein
MLAVDNRLLFRRQRLATAAAYVGTYKQGSGRSLLTRFRQALDTHGIDTLFQYSNWYLKFQGKINLIADQYGLEYETAYAAVAALSPGLSPDANIKAMVKLLDGMDSLQAYPNAVEKAKRILDTGDSLLLGKMKTQDFFRAIRAGGECGSAPIDRWAAREFAPFNKKVNGLWPDVVLNLGQYREMQAKFKHASETLGLWDAELQAILWADRRGKE